MKTANVAATTVLVLLASASIAHAQAPRLVRSLSGPSGRVVGGQFVFDETRNRFVYPQDQSLTVFFEWEAPPGDHVLSASWKQPDGRVVSVSPDVKIQTTTNNLTAYWIFTIAGTLSSGTWTVEIRVNGQPSGSHFFELAGVDPAAGRFTLDQVFKTYGPAVVGVHKLGDDGRRVDSSSGFVMATNAVATAFQAIDGADGVEVEFADGRKVQSVEILAASRLGDWAVLRVDTRSIAPIPRRGADPVAVGGRLAAFAIDSGTRLVVPVDVGAVSPLPIFGTRIRFSPVVSPESVGGPLIDERGIVVGIIGGTLTPGSRIDQRAVKMHPWLLRQQSYDNSASTTAEVPAELPASGKGLSLLKTDPAFTPVLVPMPELVWAGATTQLPKDAADRNVRDAAEFSKNDAQIMVYSYWVKKDKVTRGDLAAAVFDVQNKVRLTIPPRRVTLREQDVRLSFPLVPAVLTTGSYRIDITWDGKPVWRMYIKIVD